MATTKNISQSRRAEHKLVGCQNRLAHQITRLSKFTDKFSVVVSEDEEDLGQFVMQMIAISAHAFADEYFRCLFTVATVSREEEVRQFLREGAVAAEVGNLDAGCNLGALTGMMKQRVRFARKRARALRRTFEFLFEFEAFPDESSADLLIDLAKVRHLIVHMGAVPNENHARDIAAGGIVFQTGEFDPGTESGRKTRFYRLDLRNRFLGDALAALRETAIYHHRRLGEHPRWKL